MYGDCVALYQVRVSEGQFLLQSSQIPSHHLCVLSLARTHVVGTA